MKIHVLGCNGMLGTYVTKYFKQCGYNVEGYDRSRCNVYNFKPTVFAKTLHPDDVIINCIGLLKPNIQSYQHALDVNYNFPLKLDRICSTINCKLINFSSDCVYSGNKGSYTETDVYDAYDWYGQTKRHDDLRSTVMRISFIGEERYNKTGLLEFAFKNANKQVTGYTNCLWNGVTGLEIAKLIERMVRNDGISFWNGTRHIYSQTTVSKYELICLLNDIYDLNMTIIPTDAKNISGTVITNTLDRSLSSIHPTIQVPTLKCMITEQKRFIYEH